MLFVRHVIEMFSYHRRRGGHIFRGAAHFCPNFSIPGEDPEIVVGEGRESSGGPPQKFLESLMCSD